MCSAQLHFCFDQPPAPTAKPVLRLLSGQGHSVSKLSHQVGLQPAEIKPAIVKAAVPPAKVDLPQFSLRASSKLKVAAVAFKTPVLEQVPRKNRELSKKRIPLVLSPLVQRFCQQLLVFVLFLLPHVLA